MLNFVKRWGFYAVGGLAAVVFAAVAGPTLSAFGTLTLAYPTPPPPPECSDCENYKPNAPPCPPQNPKQSDKSGKPVTYSNGRNALSIPEIRTAGFHGWSHGRSFVVEPSYFDGLLGPGWRVGGLMEIKQQVGSVVILSGGTQTRTFTQSGSVYSPIMYFKDTLVQDTVNHTLVFTDTLNGQRWTFFDFSSSWNAARQGKLKQFSDQAGNLTNTIYSTTAGPTLDKILEVQQLDAAAPTVLTRMVYAYNLTGVAAGRLSSVTYQRSIGGVSTTVRKVDYTYYPSSGPNGPAGTLQWARIGNGTTVLDVYYHRYNALDGSGRLPIRYLLGPSGYERAKLALGTDAAIDAASDATLAQWANVYFEYDASMRVTKEIIQGKGCGCGSAGSKGTYTYAYAPATHGLPDGPNTWKMKTTETLPDGNQNIVFTSGFGATMLMIFKEVATGNQWRTYTRYDAQGRMILEALPSAMLGHDETNPALVTGAHIADAAGRLNSFDYYATTDIPNGAVAGYAKSTYVQQGELGALVLQSTKKYTSRAGSTGTIFPLASQTAYRNTNGTGAQVTSFSYTWQGTTNQVLQKTTTFPVVPTSQNGSGAATVLFVQLDKFDRPVWTKDEDGFIHALEYDALTGSVNKIIEDVNTATSTNEPAGWVTPAGGGLHLTTTLRPDFLGRDTKTTDPLGNVTFTVYKDPQHEVRIYPGWNTTTNLPTGPTQMTREDRPGSYTEELRMSATPAVLSGEPTGAEAVANLQSLTRQHLDTGDRMIRLDSYFNFSGLAYSTSASLGTLGTHFYRRSYGYDVAGRRDRNVDWTGTITRTFYDSRGRARSMWIGTDDTPTAGDWSPTNTAGTNLIKTHENEYDNNGIGDGNRTRLRMFTSSAVSLSTVFQFDFRSRETNRRGPDNVAVRKTYDNLGQVTIEETYADADQNFAIGASELRAKGETRFDENGLIYQIIRHNVDPTTGIVGNRLTSNLWSNARGLRVKSKDPNGLFAKAAYDGVGRAKAVYVCYDDTELNTDYASALTVNSGTGITADIVIDQTTKTYDLASNLIQSTRYERTSTASVLGDLSAAWASAQSRRTFTAQWFDRARRKTDSVDYGTNGGVALVRPAAAPAPNTSNGYLVTHTDFDAGGRPYRTTDNKARITESTFDGLNRLKKKIENRVDGAVAETELDTDRTTDVLYDTSSRVSETRAYNPKGTGAGVQQQITKYFYGTDANQAVPAVFRNDLLVAEIHADSDDTYTAGNPAGSKLGNGANGVYDRIEHTYDYASRKSTLKDQRGTLRTLTYDSVGRMSAETVTTLPAGVDGSIRRIGAAFDSLSRKQTVTSYSDTAGTTVVNQVKLTFDGWGNEVKCEQSHVGAVIAGTPAYQTAFVDGAVSGEAKYLRKASATYPNGRLVYSNYPAAGSVGDRLSRIDNLANDSAGTLKFAQYTYLGIKEFGRIDHPQITNGLRREVGTDGNPLEVDLFGRVLDVSWKQAAAAVYHDRFQYTYDRTSNPVTRDVTPNSPPSGRDTFYVYDGLDRLTKANRGNLALGTIADAAATFSQTWTALESQGNWRSWVEDTNGGAAGGATTQTRTHNAANELLTIAGNTPVWATPVHDASGNMTTAPKPGLESTALTLTYDAWNRLMKVQTGATTVAEYQYDALNRRVVKLRPNGANWNRRDYYYTCGWQVIEERELLNTASKTTAATTPKFQWVWDLRYLDAVVLRDENKDGDGDCVDGTDQRLYYTQDAGLNTTALVNTAGTVVERYAYDSYGKVSVLSAAWATQSATLFNNEVLFAGYRLNPETGLYQVRNREYHPTLGRWVTRDPMGLAAGLNLYQYVSSGPLSSTDPEGLQEKKGKSKGKSQEQEGGKEGEGGLGELPKNAIEVIKLLSDHTKGSRLEYSIEKIKKDGERSSEGTKKDKCKEKNSSATSAPYNQGTNGVWPFKRNTVSVTVEVSAVINGCDILEAWGTPGGVVGPFHLINIRGEWHPDAAMFKGNCECCVKSARVQLELVLNHTWGMLFDETSIKKYKFSVDAVTGVVDQSGAWE